MAGSTGFMDSVMSGGIQEGNSLMNTGIGLALQPIENSMQANQNEVLTQQQVAADEQISQFNYGQQLKLWQETNAPAQVQQYEQAGINPALMYSRGGQGGTTGTPSGGIGMGMAPGQSPAQTTAALIAGQQAQADIELKKAQAENIKARTPQEAGIMNAEISSITQGVQNQQAQQALTQAQTTTQNLQNEITGKSVDDQIAAIRAAASTTEQTLQQAVRNNYMDQNTMNDKMATIHGAMMGTFIHNNLMASQTGLQQEQITQITNNIAQQWKALEIQAQNAHINHINAETLQQNADTNTGWLKMEQTLKDLPDSGKAMMNMISQMIPSLKGTF